jgi:hypothetical protein
MMLFLAELTTPLGHSEAEVSFATEDESTIDLVAKELGSVRLGLP